MQPQAFIYGDSQTSAVGAVLQKLLQAKGWKVRRTTHSGYSVGQLADAYDGSDNVNQDLVYVFGGGNGATAADIAKLLSKLPKGHTVWIGPPPATQIVDVALAKTYFGVKVTGPNYWFESGTAKGREDRNTLIKDKVNAAPGYIYLDPRELLQPYPSMADGIHATGQAGQQLAQAILASVSSTAGGDPQGPPTKTGPGAPSAFPWAPILGAAFIGGLIWGFFRHK